MKFLEEFSSAFFVEGNCTDSGKVCRFGRPEKKVSIHKVITPKGPVPSIKTRLEAKHAYPFPLRALIINVYTAYPSLSPQ